MVHHLGRHVNPLPPVEALLVELFEPANKAKRQLLLKRLEKLKDRPVPKARQVRLPQGAIQKAILEVLSQSPTPLYVKDIHTAVQEKLQRAVSYDTVCSFLTTSARRHKDTGVHRLKMGKYLLVANHNKHDT